ncbi:MAG: hypothetical protein WAM62_12415, partial [Pseudolabrys sp.]
KKTGGRIMTSAARVSYQQCRWTQQRPCSHQRWTLHILLTSTTGDVALACALIIDALAGAAEAPVVPAIPIAITANMAMKVTRIVFSH